MQLGRDLKDRSPGVFDVGRRCRFDSCLHFCLVIFLSIPCACHTLYRLFTFLNMHKHPEISMLKLDEREADN